MFVTNITGSVNVFACVLLMVAIVLMVLQVMFVQHNHSYILVLLNFMIAYQEFMAQYFVLLSPRLN